MIFKGVISIETLGSSVPRISTGVRARDEGFGLLVVSKRTPILSLNNDSALIWKMIDGKSTLAEIISKVNQQIDGDEERNSDVVFQFVRSCYELGLLEF